MQRVCADRRTWMAPARAPRHPWAMGHIPRLQAAGTYHVTTRSIPEERIFRSDADYVDFLTIVATLVWTLHAFCVMPTHYHALATVENDVLPRLMPRLI